MNRLLIWDIDGTLLTVNRAGRAAMDQTFHEIFGIRDGFENVNMSGRLDRVIIRDAIQEKVGLIKGTEIMDLGRFYEQYEVNLINLLTNDYRGKTYPGISKVLDYIHNEDHLYSVIGTGNCKVGAMAKLVSQKIDHYFNCGAYGDEYWDRGSLIKGAIANAEDHYKVKFNLSDIFVLGDTIHDVNAAKAASVKSIAVLTGSNSLEELESSKPDYIFSNFENYNDLIKILD